MKKKIRNTIGWFVAIALISLGFIRRVKKRAKNGEFILSIFFHDPSKELFEYCIKWLLKNKFVFLSQKQVIALQKENKPLPANAVIVTVDDGWVGNFDNIAAVSAQYQIPVAIFISTEPVQNGVYWWSYIDAASKKGMIDKSVEFYKELSDERRLEEVRKIKDSLTLSREAMTPAQVKEIAENDWITIGGHTVNHPILTKCTNEVLQTELKDSKVLLEDWINKPIDSFAYPNGSYDQREVEALKELNYNIAYTTESTYLTKEHLQNLLELPRFFVIENISNQEALCRMLGVW